MNINTRRYSQDLRRYYRMPAVQVSLTLVLSVFLMSVFVVFALRPTILSIVNLKKTISESKKVLQQLETKVNFLQKASNQLETLRPVIPNINNSIPNNGAMYSPITLAIDELAYQVGVIVESESLGPTLLYSRILSPFTPNKNQKVVELSFSLRVSGGYSEVTDFLNMMMKMERIVLVDNVTIAKQAGAKNSTASVTMNVSGLAFYLADAIQLDKALIQKKGGK
ncbi:type 4a pilus biogenesis protein PilO [Candidatus Woesebacteria bacterium]|nr:type 4a pilus biogenesis protein PilO [Candidatus Woesebacteria bacterium]